MNKLLLVPLVFVFIACTHGHSKHSSHDMSMQHPMDLDKDGSITKVEWTTMFDTIDKDGDQAISKSEMKDHHHKMHGKSGHKNHHEGMKMGSEGGHKDHHHGDCQCKSCQQGEGKCKNCAEHKACSCDHKDGKHNGKCEDCDH